MYDVHYGEQCIIPYSVTLTEPMNTQLQAYTISFWSHWLAQGARIFEKLLARKKVTGPKQSLA